MLEATGVYDQRYAVQSPRMFYPVLDRTMASKDAKWGGAAGTCSAHCCG